MLASLSPMLRQVSGALSGSDENSIAKRSALTIFLIRIVSALIAFLSQVLLARWLGGFEYGVFVAVWVAVITLSTLAVFGFPSAVLRFVSHYRQKGETGLLRGSIRTGMLFSFAASTVIAAAGSLVLYNFESVVSGYFVMPLFLAAICLPMLAIQAVMDGVARAFNWPKIAMLPIFVVRPLGILFVMAAALLAGFEANAVTAMWSAIIATYCATALQMMVLGHKLRDTIKPDKPEYLVKTWIIIALPIFLVEGFYFLQTSVDILLVSTFMRPQDTAVYFASTKVLALVHFVYFAVRAAASNRFAAYSASGETGELRQFVQQTVAWTFWPSLALGAFMALTGKYFLYLFGAEFVAGEILLWILLAGIIVRSSIGPAEALLVMSDRQNICAVIYALTLLINITLNISLIPVYGLVGAAVATTFALCFETAALHLAVKRKLGIHAFVVPESNQQASIGEA